jgi:serine phosphatase RsbU (regulator of sigma subunit)
MPSITLILFIDAVHFVFARYRRLRVMAANDEPPGGSATQHGLPRRREPDLSGLATFGLSPQGQVISWSLTATALFGYQAQAVIGHDVCDVLMTGPGHRKLVGHALAEAAAGRVLTATVAGGSLGEGRFAIRWEPMTGPGDTVLVIVQSAWPQPKPGWLSEAEARIGSSLDLTRTASEVAAAAVPRLADAAVIYAAERLLAADDPAPPSARHEVAVRRLAACLAGHSEAVTGRVLPRGEVVVLDPDAPRARAMATGKPVLSTELDRETAKRLARRDGGLRVAAGYASFLAMPLVAHGAVVGCAMFGRTPASPPFSPGDLTLAGELASRAAISIDNARLYDRERRTARALQRGLLPGRPQVPAELDIAPFYQPVGDNVVGGDWHDIVPLPGGRAALIVGDAMGHGPEAATIMVQLRTAAHILARQDPAPEQLLSQLDALAADMDQTTADATVPPFATCVYTVIDAADSSCTAAQAGHLPPVIALPDGTTQVLDLPPGLPLGLGTGTFQSVKMYLEPGATIALYTDGLIESRSRPIDDGLAALRAALGSALTQPGHLLDAACHAVSQELKQHGEDDITLMLARLRTR